jgi:site-specific DNA recombinase
MKHVEVEKAADISKAIGYIRVSTEEQAREGVSLDNQKARIEQYCTYRSFSLADIIADAGISGGKNKTRPGFIELLDRIEAGQAEVVVLYSLERLSRDMLTLLALERLLDEKGIELHTVEGQVDTSSPDGWLNFAMKAFLGEMERRQVKYRTKRAMEFKKNLGAIVGSIPYGYKRNGNGLEESPQEQVVIHVVNDLYKQSPRLVDVCKFLKEANIKARNGRNFTPQQVKRLISGYQNSFAKVHGKLGLHIRRFIEAVA